MRSGAAVLLDTTLRREDRSEKTDVSDKPALNGYAFLGMGVTTAVCVVGGFAGGHWLDEQVRTSLLFTFLGLAVGIAVATAFVWAQLKKSL